MTRLPAISGRDAIRALEKVGVQLDHQTGSHIILRNPNPPYRRLTVRNHRELAKGTLRALIRQAGLTVEEFSELGCLGAMEQRTVLRARRGSEFASKLLILVVRVVGRFVPKCPLTAR